MNSNKANGLAAEAYAIPSSVSSVEQDGVDGLDPVLLDLDESVGLVVEVGRLDEVQEQVRQPLPQALQAALASSPASRKPQW